MSNTVKRKPVLYYVATIMMVSMLIFAAGCGNAGQADNAKQAENAEGKVNVVTSFYPLYYLANEIGGEQVSVMNLIPAGVEPHDWTPKSQDLHNASNAQLLLYQGAGFEGWIDDFKKGLDSKSKVKAVEISHGITLIDATHEEEEHGDEHAGEEAGHEEEGHVHGSTDPHTWVSPKSAIIMAGNVKKALVEVDPSHESQYNERYDALLKKLEGLDKKYTDELSKVTKHEIVVSHQAFGYLARDYGLTQHAIMGLSPEAEPTAQEIIKLSKIVKEEGIKYIFFEELVTDQLASTLAGEAGVDTLVLNPLEGLTEEQEKSGDNFISIMERNLDNLLKALK